MKHCKRLCLPDSYRLFFDSAFGLLRSSLGSFIAAFLIANGLVAQVSISLDECLSLARAVSADVNAMALNANISDKKKEIINSNFLPQLSAGAKVTWQSEVLELPFSFPGLDIPSVPQTQYGLNLEARQLLWDGGVTRILSRLNSTEYLIKSTSYESNRLKSDQLLIDLFFQILIIEKQIDQTSRLINQLKETQSQLMQLSSSGVIEKQSFLDLAIGINETNSKMEDLRSARQVLRFTLAQNIELNDTSLILEYPEDISPTSSLDFQHRPEIKLLNYQEELLREKAELSKAGKNPSLSAFVQSGYARPGLNLLSDKLDFFTIGGFKLLVPLEYFITGKLNRELKIWDLELEQNRLFKSDLQKQMIIRQEQHLSDIRKWQARIQLDDQTIEFQKQILDISRSQWQNGVKTTRDYLKDITTLSIAKENRQIHELLQRREFYLLRNLTENPK